MNEQKVDRESFPNHVKLARDCQLDEKKLRIQKFIEFTERESISVEKVSIPDRDTRNAR